MRVFASVLTIILLSLGLGACEQLGIPNPEKEHAKKEGEGKAVGAACRHAGRAIEDCYTLNPKAMKSAVFSGWKEMNDYMTENKLEVSIPKLTEKAAEEGVSKKRGKAERPDDGYPAPDPFIMTKPAKEPEAAKEPATEKSAEKPADKKPAKSGKAEKPEKADKADKATEAKP